MGLRPVISEIGKSQLSAKDFALLKQWIELNFDVLLAYWNGDIEYQRTF